MQDTHRRKVGIDEKLKDLICRRPSVRDFCLPKSSLENTNQVDFLIVNGSLRIEFAFQSKAGQWLEKSKEAVTASQLY